MQCWGSNTFGESGLASLGNLGDGAAPVAAFRGKVLDIAAGLTGTCAIVQANSPEMML